MCHRHFSGSLVTLAARIFWYNVVFVSSLLNWWPSRKSDDLTCPELLLTQPASLRTFDFRFIGCHWGQGKKSLRELPLFARRIARAVVIRYKWNVLCGEHRALNSEQVNLKADVSFDLDCWELNHADNWAEQILANNRYNLSVKESPVYSKGHRPPWHEHSRSPGFRPGCASSSGQLERQ